MWELLAALVAAGASIYAMNKNNHANRDLTQQNNQQMIELQKQQNQFNEDIMNKQNSYNSPSSQIGMMKTAGLNPSFMFGQGGTFSSAAPSSNGLDISTQAPRVDYSALGSSIFGGYDQLLKAKQTDASVSNLNSQSEYTQNQTKWLDEITASQIEKLKADKGLSDAKREEALQNVETLKASAKNLIASTANYNSMIAVNKEKILSSRAERKKWKAEVEMSQKRLAGELERWLHDNKLSDAQASFYRESIGKLRQEIKESLIRCDNISVSTIQQRWRNIIEESNATKAAHENALYDVEPATAWVYDHFNGWIGDVVKGVASVVTSNKKWHRTHDNANNRIYDVTRGHLNLNE